MLAEKIMEPMKNKPNNFGFHPIMQYGRSGAHYAIRAEWCTQTHFGPVSLCKPDFAGNPSLARDFAGNPNLTPPLWRALDQSEERRLETSAPNATPRSDHIKTSRSDPKRVFRSKRQWPAAGDVTRRHWKAGKLCLAHDSYNRIFNA
jgi:hypothetical protein